MKVTYNFMRHKEQLESNETVIGKSLSHFFYRKMDPSTKEMIADILTKALPKHQFITLRTNLGVKDLYVAKPLSS